MTRRATVEAPAKINLTLHVLARRPDGFHDLLTLFQAVDLTDRVTVRLGEDTGGVSLRVRPAGLDLGPDERNLAVRAAEAFRAATGLEGAVEIDLEKRIPAGAGLGGGSSDAAAVLRALDALTGRTHRARLPEIALSLGSDVPFFLGASPLAEGRGRGERLTPLDPLPETSLVLALPPVHVSTADAYGALAATRELSPSPRHAGPGGEGETTPPEAPDTVDVHTWGDVARIAHNDFESVVAPRHNEIEASLSGLREAGARVALLSGSGAASFGIFDSAGEADAAAKNLSETLGWPFVATRTLRSLPGVRLDG